ncbi:hypothetical protein APF79_13480 [bacterium BRH_c32]|nr:MAG: hypothetical protein APF79_13480 [bacterium BRH_c32]
MTTLPAAGFKPANADSIESKIDTIVESLSEYISIKNERVRLAFNLYKFLKGEGDGPEVVLSSAKIRFENISKVELVTKINLKLKEASLV